MKQAIKRYLWNLLVALDQFVNTLAGGDPDMTLSGRMGRAIAERRCIGCRLICWVLDRFDPGHCDRVSRAEADEGADEIVKL